MSDLRDSVDKVVKSYFAVVTKVPFTYKGKTYTPGPFRVSPGIFRGYTCPASCGACCHRFSLDYIPAEDRPEGLLARSVDFDGRKVLLYSDLQTDHNDHHCRNLNKETGRCGIHGQHPFTCDFELIRFSQAQKEGRLNYINQRLYGRGWAMLRVDGERGAKCQMITGDENWKNDTSRRLGRLEQWADHFQLPTYLKEIIEWVNSGPHEVPLTIGEECHSHTSDQTQPATPTAE